MPWGTWITCEETVNGPDVGPDFTGVSNVPLTQRHGFIFEVPAGGQSNRQPITSAGRFAHEAAAWSPKEGALYLTEDNFGFPSGFYRYFPPTDPMETGSLANGGRLQMLRVVGQTERPSRGQPDERRDLRRRLGRHRRSRTRRSRTRRVSRRRPRTTTPSATSATRVGRRAPPTSRASRAPRSRRDEIYFDATQGGGAAETGPAADHAATATAPARSGRTTRRSRRSRASSSRRRGRPRPARQHHPQRPRHDRHLRGRPRRQLHARADDATASSSTSP